MACEERAHGFVELVACWDGALCYMEASEEFTGDGHWDGSLEAAGRVVAKDLLSSEIERGACAGCDVELRVAWRAVDWLVTVTRRATGIGRVIWVYVGGVRGGCAVISSARGPACGVPSYCGRTAGIGLRGMLVALSKR